MVTLTLSDDVSEAPILYHVYLPPSHPFHRWTDEKWRAHWGPHVARHVTQPIPPLNERPDR